MKSNVAVVTGASSGIGKAISIELAKDGFDVVVLGRDARRLDSTIKHLESYGSRSFLYEIDLTVDSEIDNLLSYFEDRTQGLDVLIHSAGIIYLDRMEKASIEDFDKQHRSNVRAPYLLTQKLLPALKYNKGQVVFINSSAGLNAKAGAAQYAGTKHALKAVADSLREEMNADGVRVLSVYPGRTASPMQAMVCKMEGRAYLPDSMMQPSDVASVVINTIKLPRTAEVTDINIRTMCDYNTISSSS